MNQAPEPLDPNTGEPVQAPAVDITTPAEPFYEEQLAKIVPMPIVDEDAEVQFSPDIVQEHVEVGRQDLLGDQGEFMSEPTPEQTTPDAVTTHEEVQQGADGSVTHTLDTEVAAGDAATEDN